MTRHLLKTALLPPWSRPRWPCSPPTTAKRRSPPSIAPPTSPTGTRSSATTTRSKLTMVLSVDPLLEPSNGPNYFPFDPEILYEMKVDNDHDAVEDVTFSSASRPSSATPACSLVSSAACSASRLSPRSTVPARKGWACARPTPSPRPRQPALRPDGGRKLSRYRAMSVRAPCPITRRSTTRASTTSAMASASSPAPPTTRSTSISAQPSTR